MPVITITRSKLYPTGGAGRRFEFTWTYRWSASDDSHVIHMPDGRAADGGGYGRGLTDLKAMLRRRYGRTVTIETSW